MPALQFTDVKIKHTYPVFGYSILYFKVSIYACTLFLPVIATAV